MHVLAAILALFLIFVALLDAFETVILPRRVSGLVHLTGLIYASTWQPWKALAQRMRGQHRETFLGFYGPLALLFLLVTWMTLLILGYALLQWSFGSTVSAVGLQGDFGTDLYYSGTTFLTLGLGDISPHSGIARFLTVIEAGTGFGILALVIGYLPVLYQAFSRREASISLLDARAGSPPSATELLVRFRRDNAFDDISPFLAEWERWCAELLESQISYPSVGYFRSQHDNQSWLAALSVVLDVSALILVGVDDIPKVQARRTFAMGRHAAVDLSQVFYAPPYAGPYDRLSERDEARMRALFAEADVQLASGPEADEHLRAVRQKYEPYVAALSERLLMPLPPWVPIEGAMDDWQTSVYEHLPERAFEEAIG